MTATQTSEPRMKEMSPVIEDFAALLDESLASSVLEEGIVIKGRIVAIEKDVAVIDVGLKTEGRVPLKEFSVAGRPPDVGLGDEVEVYLERVENAMGEAVLSREKARREESWTRLEEKFNKGEKVEGVIFNKVKGGFTVDLDGAVAFLPGSQVDIRPIRDVNPLMNVPQPFQILKMDRRRGNIVVSRRSVLEETRAEQRSEIVAKLEEGQVVDGVVKNITDYGAFIDLGGIDGLLHVTDMAWRRVNHPSEILNVGDTVKVQIIRINPETQRISLGMKQLEADPWEGIAAKYPISAKVSGKVTNITDYGAFVELEPGVEGLIHVSEMSWVKKNVHPGKIVSTSQEVEVQVLDVDPQKRRISLGLKQCQENPWRAFADEVPQGHRDRRPGAQHHRVRPVHRPRRRHRRHGPPVRSGLEPSRRRSHQGLQQGRCGQGRGARRRSRQGAHQPGREAARHRSVPDSRQAEEGRAGHLRSHRSEGSRHRGQDHRNRRAARSFAAPICPATAPSSAPSASRSATWWTPPSPRWTATAARSPSPSRRLEIAEEKEAVAQYGSTDSGASLGDILGAALSKAQEKDEPEGKEG